MNTKNIPREEDKLLKYKAIEEVFQVKYFIDFYQRDYTWSYDSVYTLLEDIYHRFDLKYNVDSNPTPKDIKLNYKWYYLNTYIINIQDDKTCIVDGQQRFSTITLILIKLYHLGKNKELSESRLDTLKALIYKSTSEGQEYWMGGNDRTETLKDLFKNQANTNSKRELKISDKFFYDNYKIVGEYLDEKFLSSDSHYLECFLIYFITNIKLVEIKIEESDDVAMVFEVINAKGQKLKSHEILKSQLLSQINKNEIDTYLNHWNDACKVLQDSKLTYPNIDDPIDAFFTYFFRARFTYSDTEILTFKDYHKTIFSRKWQERLPFKKDVEFVKHFIANEFLFYAKKMKELIQTNYISQKHVYFNLRINDISNLYLIILSSVTLNDPQYELKIDLLAKLVDRHYMILRLQGCYDSNGFNKLISALVIKIRDRKSLEEIREEFDESLKTEIQRIKDVEINDFLNYSYFANAKVVGNNKTFVRYLFARIEEFLCDKMNHTAFAGYDVLCQGKKYNIEHILARNEENQNIFKDEDYFNEQRDRIGGLLLLKQGDNNMSLAETYKNKLITYTNDTIFAKTLTSNFYHNNSGLKQFKLEYPTINFIHIPKFDFEALESRQKLVFEICKNIWGGSNL